MCCETETVVVQYKLEMIWSKFEYNSLTLTLTLIVGGCTISFLYFYRKNGLNKKALSNMSSAALLPEESNSLTLILPATSTMTIYDGEVNESYLQQRVDLIIKQNMWLKGRLFKNSKSGLTLEYPATNFDSKTDRPYFLVMEDSGITDDINYEEMIGRIKCFLVRDGNECIKNISEPLFRVTLIKITSLKFALVVSLSHVIGDGHTFYRLYSMLDPQVPIESLIPSRVHSFKADVEKKLTGMSESLQWLLSAGTILNMITTIFFSTKPALIRLQKIDYQWINSQKLLAKDVSVPKHSNIDLPYISTNDVLTSWILTRTQSKYDLGLMAINLRNRVELVTNQHAGNYEGVLAYQVPDFQNPSLIRKSLLNYRWTVSESLPSFLQSLRTKFCMVSNWASFFHQVELPGCKHVIHLPTYVDNKLVAFDVYILFKLNKDQIACLSYARIDCDIFPEGDCILR